MKMDNQQNGHLLISDHIFVEAYICLLQFNLLVFYEIQMKLNNFPLKIWTCTDFELKFTSKSYSKLIFNILYRLNYSCSCSV